MTAPNWLKDRGLLFGFILAHLLMYFTFQDTRIFWHTFTATMLFLISYSILLEGIENQLSLFKYLIFGLVSGIVLFLLFWIGNQMIVQLDLPIAKEITHLYRRLSPQQLWQYFVLLLIIIPGEEIFWRGFVQKQLQKNCGMATSVLLASIMYASAHIYSGSFILPFAALVSGIFWGYLFGWKKSLPLLIVSHLIFDVFLFVIFPFG